MRIEFKTDNDSFIEAPAYERCKVLNAISEAVFYGKTEGTIRDTNGNKIGNWEA